MINMLHLFHMFKAIITSKGDVYAISKDMVNK